jgi:7-carboxy-7-deazaguanine synthase
MFISEIFYSIQGEGELSGVPSVFIRTSGCNLRCSWCDTKYASWRPEGAEISIEQIIRDVTSFPASHCVITGGEPMIAKGISTLTAALSSLGKHITIETAGTISPNDIRCDLASISPKLSNSIPTPSDIPAEWIARHERDRLQPDILREWIDRYPYQLKFVVESALDLTEIREILAGIDRLVPPWKVLVMPQGFDEDTIRGRDQTMIDLCLRSGYRYCNRLQIKLFGNTRGT